MSELRVPAMVIASCDDPWIPVGSHRRVDRAGNPSLVVLMPPAGGPIGFPAHDGTRLWCDPAVEKFIDRLANMEA